MKNNFLLFIEQNLRKQQQEKIKFKKWKNKNKKIGKKLEKIWK